SLTFSVSPRHALQPSVKTGRPAHLLTLRCSPPTCRRAHEAGRTRGNAELPQHAADRADAAGMGEGNGITRAWLSPVVPQPRDGLEPVGWPSPTENHRLSSPAKGMVRT